MTQILFFALKEDLLEVIDSAERGEKVIYAKMGRYLEPEFPIFEGGHKIPGVGVATSESSIACEEFLVARSESSFCLRSVNENSGIKTFRLDQLINPDTIVLLPAGRWDENVVLQGSLVHLPIQTSPSNSSTVFDRGSKQSFRRSVFGM